MCTIAWGTRQGRLWICFNRDENRERPLAEKPRLHQGPNGLVAYARDPSGGGTWFAASNCGFAVALLNYYPAPEGGEGKKPRSRGLLVTDLAGCASAAEAYTRLSEEELDQYPPFHLFLLSGDSGLGMSWDGSGLTFVDEETRFFTTSSHEPERISRFRKGRWLELPDDKSMDPTWVADWMRSSRAGEGAFGIVMERPDARTVSQILLEMTGSGFRLLYYERDPDGPGFLEPVGLEYSQ